MIEAAPVYVCHKEVRALKIARANIHSNGQATLSFEDVNFSPIRVDITNRPTPEMGMWYIVYPDNYHSFSPSAAFESGYTLKS